jgi:protein-tyrosine phosphatase
VSREVPKVLMVCLGNICRSPMAEGILKHKAEELGIDIIVDSAGTSNFHEGEQPDPRAMAEMAANGIDISDQRSRPFTAEDFDRFDHILVMDTSNRTNVVNMARTETDKQKVRLILDHGNAVKGHSVPDPYYDDGFGRVYELLDYACGVFLEKLH